MSAKQDGNRSSSGSGKFPVKKIPPTGLPENDASPPERDGRVREKDAGSGRSGATDATEDALSRRPVRSGGLGFVFRLPPSHDYIRRDGSGPKDGWAKGPGDPGPASRANGDGAKQATNVAGSNQSQPPADPPPYGDIHKFGYTRPLKKHEQTDLAGQSRSGGPPPGSQPPESPPPESPSSPESPQPAPSITKDAPTDSYLYANGQTFGYGQRSIKEGPLRADDEASDPQPEKPADDSAERLLCTIAAAQAGQAAPQAPGQAPDQPDAAPPPPDDFVHLHVHSNFSFLDGGSRVEELVARAAELGQTALALTDHDGLYGIVRFAKACAKRGIKPIFGAEVRVESLLPDGADATPAAPTATRDDPHHLVLLAETREGYANLCRLLSAAHLGEPERERPPLVDLESLAAHAKGLVCLTGCRHGQVGFLVDAGRDAQAHAALLRLREIFGPAHLYVELHYFGYEPHEQARPGQHGARVFEKIRVEGNRLGHRETPPEDDDHDDPSFMQSHCTTTYVASRGSHDTAAGAPVEAPRPRPAHPQPRPDLPHGQPQRLNPADYDVGFHRDGRAWRLSCLTYCERLARLAASCGLPTVLTTDAHYAA